MIRVWFLDSKKIFFIFFFFQLFLYTQTIVKGNIASEKGNLISHGVVLLKDSKTKKITAYTNIDEKGNYQIEFNLKEDVFIVEISSLGYEKKSIVVNKVKQELIYKRDFILLPKDVELNEVIVSSSPIKIKKDTIEYTASRFKRGNEENVEDLLRNLPGITVDINGKIKYDKQEIEKVMVDGEDLFDKGYKLLTKNMPVNPVKKIEVLKNFSDNKLLKGIDDTNKIALNLKLGEKFKRIWFGNLKSNISVANTKGFYNINGNLMNFGKKSKHYMLVNLNNTGFETTGDVYQLMSSVNLEGHLNSHSSQLLNLNIPRTVFSGDRTNFNDSELVSTSSIFNLSTNSKIKFVSFFNSDENYFVKNSFTEINTETANFRNTENTRFTNTKRDVLGKLEFSTSLFSKKDEFVIKSAFKKNSSKKNAAIVFNENKTNEKINSEEEFVDVNLQYTNKLDKRKALLINGSYLYNESPQNYSINQFFYTNLFSNPNEIERAQQVSGVETQASSIKGTLHNKLSKKNYFRVEIGNKNRVDRLKTAFLLLSNNNVFTNNNYVNDLSFKINDLYLKNTYRLKFKGFELRTKLNLHQINSFIGEFLGEKESKSSFFVNPKVNAEWIIDKKNTLSFNYSYNTSQSKVKDVYNNYVNTSFRRFLKGTGNFNLLNSSQLSLNYEFGNPNDNFLMRSNFSITNMYDYFSTNTVINRNYSQSNKVLFKDRIVYSTSQEFEYYLAKFSTNLRVGFEHNRSSFKNLLNNSILRNIRTQNYKYKIELRSAFGNDFFDYHVGIDINNSRIKSSVNNTFQTNTSFLNLYFNIGKRLNLDINSTFYDLNSEFSNSTIFFLDFKIKYKLLKEKITVGLIGKNLLNNKKYEEVNITDNFYSVQSYELLPRYVLLRFDYNF